MRFLDDCALATGLAALCTAGWPVRLDLAFAAGRGEAAAGAGAGVTSVTTGVGVTGP